MDTAKITKSYTCKSIKLTIQYDGSKLYGWQYQLDRSTVQEKIEFAIFNMTGQKIRIYGAGRTDSGVHATGQVAHFSITTPHCDETIRNAINHYLKGSGVYILHAEQIDSMFHARFSAKNKKYTYLATLSKTPCLLFHGKAWNISKGIDIHKMQKAISMLEGTHDFSSFTTDKDKQKHIKTITQATIKTQTAADVKLIIFTFESQSFLRNQIRIMVGTLCEIGIGTKQNINHIIQQKSRSAAGITAPPCGLYLTKVYY